MARVIGRKKLQILVLNSSATFRQESLSFIEVAKSDAGLSIAEMDDANVIIGECAIDIGYYFILGHFIKIGLNVRKMKKLY